MQITRQGGSEFSAKQHEGFSTIRSGTTGALSITQGMTAGNIVQFDAPKVQLTAPTYSDDANVAMLGATLSLNPNVGDDELTITVK